MDFDSAIKRLAAMPHADQACVIRRLSAFGSQRLNGKVRRC